MKTITLHIYDSSNVDVTKLHQFPYLTDEDICNINKFQTELGKREQIISAYFKRKYVGEYYLDKNKKPISDRTFFNISHSNGIVIFAQADVPIGVDIEHIKKIDKDIKEYVTSEEEYRSIKTDEDFFKIWINKESLLKANGCGLTKDIKNVPAFPIEGIREYKGKKYYSHIIKDNNYLISVTIQDTENFNIKVIKEYVGD